eukprot:gnl/Carplike_NY0171/2189_a2948_916.p1 GENE.gnl/Carplike_NY0171/2189_a2948_916~~gnl/Carplike_NY0171/2189_a2948_916.p1  ORF type:complete len:581 (-),score=175.41 gnl/Carplike_NY0171/2189_a2948_916:75-1565(-)
MTVKSEEVDQIRPFVVCAVLRGVTFTEAAYNSFIDLQDKLHHNLCRRRRLVAIGTHDLSTIKAPFRYHALPPKDISFIPLNCTEEMDGDDLMKHYEHSHLSDFLTIIRDSPVYPVIYDSDDVVLSLPPIINGDHSKISLHTKDVFIEATATDHTKAMMAVNSLTTLFSMHSSTPFQVEQVEVIYEKADGSKVSEITPSLKEVSLSVGMDLIKSYSGVDLSREEACECANKMGLVCSPSPKCDKEIDCIVPVARGDIMHACDIVEDVIIGYGLDKIPQHLPEAVGSFLPLNRFTDLLRMELAMAGYTETLNFSMCSADDYFYGRGFPLQQHPNPHVCDGKGGAVWLSNPKTESFHIMRPSVFPGLMKALGRSKILARPVKLFETADITVSDEKTDTGARNERHIGVVYSAAEDGFEHIHGICDFIVQKIVTEAKWEKGMSLKLIEEEHCEFLSGRGVKVMYEGKEIGKFGVVHPRLIKYFDIGFPCSYLELNLNKLL